MENDYSKEVIRNKILSYAEIIFVSTALAVRVYILYFPFKFYNYLVVPGGDPANHYTMVKEVISGQYNLIYPKLFHLMIAKFSLLSGLSVMDSFKAVTPLLVVLPSIAIYLFARRHFGRLAALISFAFMLWGGSNYGLLAFGDGNYPNILAAGFFMPLAFLFVLNALKKGGYRNYLWALLFIFLTVLTHHLTTAMLCLVLIVYLICLGYWNRSEKVTPRFRKLAFLLVLFMVVLAICLSYTSLKIPFVRMWQSLSSVGSVMGGDMFNQPLQYDEYAPQIGSFIWPAGIISLFILIYLMGQKKEGRGRAVYLFILVWVGALFVLSRLEMFGLPGRFVREMAFPLTLSIGVSFAAILHRLPKMSKIFTLGLLGLVVVINLTQINSGYAKSPDFFKSMIWFTEQDKEKSDYLRDLTSEGDKIIANPTTPYLPIFSERNVVFVSARSVSSLGELGAYVKRSGAKYLFVGRVTAANPDGKAYPFFADFDLITQQLDEYAQDLGIEREFSDGSTLYILIGD